MIAKRFGSAVHIIHFLMEFVHATLMQKFGLITSMLKLNKCYYDEISNMHNMVLHMALHNLVMSPWFVQGQFVVRSESG